MKKINTGNLFVDLFFEEFFLSLFAVVKLLLWFPLAVSERKSLPKKSLHLLLLFEREKIERKKEYLLYSLLLGEIFVISAGLYWWVFPQTAPWFVVLYVGIGFFADLTYKKKFGERFID